MDKATAFEIVYQAVDIVNGLRPESEQLPKAPDLILAGSDSALDSLALVTFILAVEDRVSAIAGKEIGLLDESGLGDDAGALGTAALLVDLIIKRVGA